MDFEYCPICGKRLMIDIFRRECTNSCYEQHIYHTVIFNEVIRSNQEEKIRQNIDYWVKDDRYLAKIMSRSGE